MDSKHLRYQKYAAALLCLVCLAGLFGCSPPYKEEAPTPPQSTPVPEETVPSLHFDGRRYAFSGSAEAIRAEGAVITICQGGRYRISGTLKEGTLSVAVPRGEVVHLLLDGVSITSSAASPLQITSAACVILESATGSVNRLADTPSDIAAGSVIEAACPLLLRGEGNLILSGRRAYGIHGTDDVILESGHLTLSAPKDALWVRDRFELIGGRLTVTEAARGIVVGEGRTDEGQLRFCGGDVVIQCADTALSATRSIVAEGGTGSLRARRRYICTLVENEIETAGIIAIAENWLLAG